MRTPAEQGPDPVRGRTRLPWGTLPWETPALRDPCPGGRSSPAGSPSPLTCSVPDGDVVGAPLLQVEGAAHRADRVREAPLHVPLQQRRLAHVHVPQKYDLPVGPPHLPAGDTVPFFPRLSGPCARGAAGAAGRPEAAQTRDSRRLGLAGTPNLRAPSPPDSWECGRGSASPRWAGAWDPTRRPPRASRPRRSAPGPGRPGPAPSPAPQTPGAPGLASGPAPHVPPAPRTARRAPHLPPARPGGPGAWADPRPSPGAGGAFRREAIGRLGQVGAPGRAPGRGGWRMQSGVPGGGSGVDAAQGRGPGLLTSESRGGYAPARPPRLSSSVGASLAPGPGSRSFSGVSVCEDPSSDC